MQNEIQITPNFEIYEDEYGQFEIEICCECGKRIDIECECAYDSDIEYEIEYEEVIRDEIECKYFN